MQFGRANFAACPRVEGGALVVKIINFRNYNKVCRTVDPTSAAATGRAIT